MKEVNFKNLGPEVRHLILAHVEEQELVRKRRRPLKRRRKKFIPWWRRIWLAISSGVRS